VPEGGVVSAQKNRLKMTVQFPFFCESAVLWKYCYKRFNLGMVSQMLEVEGLMKVQLHFVPKEIAFHRKFAAAQSSTFKAIGKRSCQSPWTLQELKSLCDLRFPTNGVVLIPLAV
jgi:hypothetical protein